MVRSTTAREGDVPPPPVRAIGPYEVLALLGKGSNGTVVLGRGRIEVVDSSRL